MPTEKIKAQPHLRNIASGLKALISIGQYYVEGELASKSEYLKFALQHLETGYKEIYMIYYEMYGTYDGAYGPEKKDCIKCRIDEKVEELCNNVSRKFEDQSLCLKPGAHRYIAETLIEYSLSYPLEELRTMLDQKVYTDKHGLAFGKYSLSAVKNKEKTICSKEMLKIILNTFEENKNLLQKMKKLYEQLNKLEREFKDKVDLLIKKIVDLEELEGFCNICKEEDMRL